MCSSEIVDFIYSSKWHGMKNKAAKLIERMIRYIIRAKNKRTEHQKNRGGHEAEFVLSETCLDALDENQDAAKYWKFWTKKGIG